MLLAYRRDHSLAHAVRSVQVELLALFIENVNCACVGT